MEYMPLVALRDTVVLPYTLTQFDVGRARSVRAIKKERLGLIFVSMQLDENDAEFSADSVHHVGCVVRVEDCKSIGGGAIHVIVNGMCRARIVMSEECDGYVMAGIEREPCEGYDAETDEAYFRTVKTSLSNASSVSSKLNPNTVRELLTIKGYEMFIYRTASKLDLKPDRAQALLDCSSLSDAFYTLDREIAAEMEIVELERKINESVKESIDRGQKEFYLREQLKAIHKELGDEDNDHERLEKEIKEKHLRAEDEEKVMREFSRMSRMPSATADYNVLRTYIETICDLPIGVYTEDTESLQDAVKILNDDHYGLEKVKERITEYLAVLKLTDGMNAPILCLVGPPGVGKTSVAQSVARALGRKFVRMSLGGVRDESEIRGHRKTYVGAMPGRIAAAIKTAGCMNPVFLLDEIDKLSSDIQGDPASALLEVLDPAQNSTFRDRYLEIQLDLSKVLFITTANSLDTIPSALRDRMEIINIEGYMPEEKTEIGMRYLVPKRVKQNGLDEGDVTFTVAGIDEIITGYTMEAGVRSLDRQIDAVCRKIAVKKAEGGFEPVTVDSGDVEKYLGVRRYERDAGRDTDEVGAATGLAWTAVGGTTLTIEVSAMQGKGDILLTGKLGDVMKESARAAISYIRSKSDEYGIDSSRFETTDIHVHVPEGATPKDGPSAGITMATAILSAFTGKPVRHDVAMTGEITLRGKVLPIGGLKEKAIAAYRTGITDVIIPEENTKDLEDMPRDIKEKINFIPVSSADTVFRNAIIGL